VVSHCQSVNSSANCRMSAESSSTSEISYASNVHNWDVEVFQIRNLEMVRWRAGKKEFSDAGFRFAS
jgi:hypothetical protein